VTKREKPLDDEEARRADIKPLWYLQKRDEDSAYRELCWLIKFKAVGFPAPYLSALQDAIGAVSRTWTRARPIQELVDKGYVPPGKGCPLSDAEILARLEPIYAQAADLIIAMRGTPLLYALQVGDWAGLIRKLRHGYASYEEQYYVAGILEGSDNTRAANRHRTQATDLRNRSITWFILDMREEGVGDDTSVDRAADRFELGKRYVQEIFKEYREREIPFRKETIDLLTRIRRLNSDMKVN